jgi:hypothetical protein
LEQLRQWRSFGQEPNSSKPPGTSPNHPNPKRQNQKISKNQKQKKKNNKKNKNANHNPNQCPNNNHKHHPNRNHNPNTQHPASQDATTTSGTYTNPETPNKSLTNASHAHN